MSLVFTIKDAVFDNYVTVLMPPNTPFAWYDFGNNLTQSTTDKSGNNNNLSVLGTSADITYTDSTVVLPQTSSSQNVLQLTTPIAAASYSIGASLKSGQYERIAMLPITSSAGLLVDSSGAINLNVSTDVGTIKIASSPINRPCNIAASVDVGTTGQVTLRLKVKDSFDVEQLVEQTFTATPVAGYNTQPTRIGNNAVGSMELGELILYTHALSADELNALVDYMA